MGEDCEEHPATIFVDAKTCPAEPMSWWSPSTPSEKLVSSPQQ